MPSGPAVLLHAATLFTSAFLLFWIQPLVARMALPTLGGVPAVWNTAMVFFQASLLGGYLYAHLLCGLRPGFQRPIHAGILGLSLLFLPPQLQTELLPDSGEATALRLFLALAAAIGLPALALSATAPLLQGWYSRSGRHGAEDPYFLYSASNAGSLAALLGFPSLLEPLLPLRQQSWLWGGGFLLLAALTLLCGRGRRIGEQRPAELGSGKKAVDAQPSPGLQARWVLLALAPSSLLLGTTTHLTTDVASVPLLWVVPLALYLLTYVMAFSRRTWLPERWALHGHAASVALIAVVLAYAVPRAEKAAALFPVHLAALFLTSLICHGELARLRPPAAHLTRFYLALAAGGVLGGLFNAFLAPQLFTAILEYPLVLAAACLLRPSPGRGGTRRQRLLDFALPGALFAAVLASTFASGTAPGARWTAVGLGGAACLLLSGRPLRFALALAALVVAGRLTHAPLGAVLAAERNFYGLVQVIGAGEARILYDGKTIHGAQFTGERHRAVPLSYYTPAGPVGDIFDALGPALAGARIGVVGLGSGTLAAHGRAGQTLVFFEINPAVARIAADPRLFTYLADSGAAVEVRIGDGRLGLAAGAAGEYGLIVVDAFSSDAVPVHLLTQEAVRLYLSKLAPEGALVFNVTNDYLDLEGVLGRIAADLGLAALARLDEEQVVATEEVPFKLPSDWLVLARSPGVLSRLAGRPGWGPPRFCPDSRPWSDDHAGLLAAFKDAGRL